MGPKPKILGNVIEAHAKGAKARAMGWSRVSPYVNGLMTEYFEAGFNGKNLRKMLEGSR